MWSVRLIPILVMAIAHLTLFGQWSAQNKFSPLEDCVAIVKEPEVVRKVDPKYPELAMRAGLEGRVWVKIWVDKEGKPKQVEIAKSDAEIFNQSAIEAARQFLFTPAVGDNGPVSVWVSVPLTYKLTDRKNVQLKK